MEELPEGLPRRKLYVEDAMSRIRKKNDRYRFKLMQVAVEFVERLPILPLTTSTDYLRGFLPYPGVYLIYYVGTTSLYGNLVKPSQGRPIYIGMSRTNILIRLKNHEKKVNAEDLGVRNFYVRFLIVDIEHYAPSIEGALIEFYNPLWNDKNVEFNFGNGESDSNNWKKYHVDQNERVREDMIERVREYYQER